MSPYLNVALGPGGVRRTGGFGDNGDKDEESNGENSLLVEDLRVSLAPKLLPSSARLIRIPKRT